MGGNTPRPVETCQCSFEFVPFVSQIIYDFLYALIITLKQTLNSLMRTPWNVLSCGCSGALFRQEAPEVPSMGCLWTGSSA